MVRLPTPKKPFLSKAVPWLTYCYENFSMNTFVRYLCQRAIHGAREAGIDCDDRGVKAWYTDCLVFFRLVLVIGLVLCSPILPSWLLLLLAGLVQVDILIAHSTHLLVATVGSAGPGIRYDLNRSFVIAVLNVGVLIFAFATEFTVAEHIGRATALGESVSSITSLGLVAPTTHGGRAVALTEVLIGIFMLTVVFSTVLASFAPRTELPDA